MKPALDEFFADDVGKQQDIVVPKSARGRDCGVTGTKLTDPDKWGDWSKWSMCAACCKKWAEAEDLKAAATTPELTEENAVDARARIALFVRWYVETLHAPAPLDAIGNMLDEKFEAPNGALCD